MEDDEKRVRGGGRESGGRENRKYRKRKVDMEEDHEER